MSSEQDIEYISFDNIDSEIDEYVSLRRITSALECGTERNAFRTPTEQQIYEKAKKRMAKIHKKCVIICQKTIGGKLFDAIEQQSRDMEVAPSASFETARLGDYYSCALKIRLFPEDPIIVKHDLYCNKSELQHVHHKYNSLVRLFENRIAIEC
jgi:hypothetical protein